jgi:predicted nucleotidyltransferase component of viral defense system
MAIPRLYLNAAVNPKPQDFADAAEALGLPSPDLVEKDYWVVRVLSAIHALSDAHRTFVFGGGTSICRAYRLIDRMSEDIDLRVIGPEPFSSGMRSGISRDVEAVLAGLKLNGHGYRKLAFDGSRKLEFHLPYEQTMPAKGALRNEIKLELAFYPLQLEVQEKSVSSFLSQASEQPAELQGLPCVALEETAAEKFLALLRRVGAWQQRTDGEPFDSTLIRHVHDLGRMDKHIKHAEVLALIRGLIPDEAARYGRSHPEFAADPLAEMGRVLHSLNQPEYAQHFSRFQKDMVYDNMQDYGHCLALITAIYEALQRKSRA